MRKDLDLTSGWVELFRVGTYGPWHFTEADLDEGIEGFRTDHPEVPIVIGHPQKADPAWGWVDELRRDGATLLGRFKQVDPDFATVVKAGRYKTRSVRWRNYPDGRKRIMHVGFLGAKLPGVKGLQPIDFADDDGDHDDQTIDFEEETTMDEQEIQRRVDAAVATALATRDQDFAEERTRLEADLATERRTRRRIETEAFVKGLVDGGKLPPALTRDGELVDFMESLADGKGEGEVEIDFAEGEATHKVSPRQWMERFLGGLQGVVDFSEQAGRNTDPGASVGEDQDFAAPDEPGLEVDVTHMDVYRRAMAHQREHKTDFKTSLQAVAKKS